MGCTLSSARKTSKPNRPLDFYQAALIQEKGTGDI